MRPLVRSPLLGFLGLVAVGLVAYKMLQGDLTLTQGAVRAVIALVVVVLVERLVLPIAMLLVGSPATPPPPAAAPAPVEPPSGVDVPPADLP